MTLILAENAPRFDIPDVQFTGFASPSRGASENSVWRVRIAAGSAGVPHRLTREEILVAISGNARATLGGKTFDFPAGATLIVPPETDFALANPGSEPFEAIAVLPVGGAARIGGDAPFTPPWAL